MTGKINKPLLGDGEFEGDKMPQNAELALKFFELAKDYYSIGEIYLKGCGIE